MGVMHITPELSANKKSLLISIGHARVDTALQTPEYVGSSTAGPGAGGRSVFFASGGKRVRLSIREESLLLIKPDGDGVTIERDGVIIAEGELERIGMHCPQQAYITVSERCCFTVHSIRFLI